MKFPDKIRIFCWHKWAEVMLSVYLKDYTKIIGLHHSLAIFAEENDLKPASDGEPYGIFVEQREQKKVPGYTGDDSFHISVTEHGATLSAATTRGTMYAVYAFLEDFVGARFLTDQVEWLPETPELRLDEKEYTPSFLYRDVYWTGALDRDFALKMRLNSARADIPSWLGGGVSFYNYSHSFEELVPPDEFFDTHPEYFSFFDGKRQREHSQLCLTNPDVLQICVERVRGWMRKNPACRIFSVSQNDWYGCCECPACRALDGQEGSHAGTVLSFVNQIADAIREDFPDNYLHTFAYLYSRMPPKTIRPRDNVIVRLSSIESCFSHPMRTCGHAIADISVDTGSARGFQTGERLFRDDLAAWGRIANNLFVWDYTTNFANYLQPFPNIHVMQDNLRLMKENGVSGVLEQGNYSGGAASAFGALKIYVLSHLLWDVDADVPALVRDFMTHYFEDAAQPMMDVLRMLEEGAQQAHMGIFDPPNAPCLPVEVIDKVNDRMNEALDAAQSDKIYDRVLLEKMSVNYVILTIAPLYAQNRERGIEVFEHNANAFGITELFERRDFDASIECMKKSRFCKDRSDVPYRVYRL